MQTRKLKSIIMYFVLILFSMLFGFIGCTSQIEQGDGGTKSIMAVADTGNFSLEFSVNKTKLRVGDTIEVSATFKNLSGKDLYIEFPDHLCYNATNESIQPEDLVQFVVMPSNHKWAVISIKADPRFRTVLEKDAEICRTEEIAVDEHGAHFAFVCVSFYIGEDLSSSDRFSENFGITTESINITVKR